MFARFLFAEAVAFVLVAVVALESGCSNALQAGGPKEPVQLKLSTASAERWENNEVLFQCEAVLVNNTTQTLHVKSTFYSAFDGLSLVVLNEQGKKLLQQPYVSHQSPFDPKGRLFPLAKGENNRTLVFPIRGLPKELKKVRVLLVGTLPGTEPTEVLCSDMDSVFITKHQKLEKLKPN